MFNFSASNIQLINTIHYNKSTVFLVKDNDTNRIYRLYDYSKSIILREELIYKIYGKVNSADKLYLILENVHPQKVPAIKFSKNN